MPNKKIIEGLQAEFNDALEVSNDGSYDILTIEKGQLHALCENLKKDGFNYLANLTAVDYEDRFEVVYHIHSVPENRKIAVKTIIDYGNPEVSTVIDIWRTADWQEREVYDLLGIKFAGHPNLIRILLPYDYEAHPLRKDFKLK
ncbi:MAG TPA: NADH-quinone oxidoreductase subunit C [Syntrophomonadaceae bacterium]|nr:NADH-quinone oxidoreductase subunit C [Syntrophomonadaceae bacterium]